MIVRAGAATVIPLTDFDGAAQIYIREDAVILRHTGDLAKELADAGLCFPVSGIQIAENLQLIVGHMVMQWLYARRDEAN